MTTAQSSREFTHQHNSLICRHPSMTSLYYKTQQQQAQRANTHILLVLYRRRLYIYCIFHSNVTPLQKHIRTAFIYMKNVLCCVNILHQSVASLLSLPPVLLILKSWACLAVRWFIFSTGAEGHTHSMKEKKKQQHVLPHSGLFGAERQSEMPQRKALSLLSPQSGGTWRLPTQKLEG